MNSLVIVIIIIVIIIVMLMVKPCNKESFTIGNFSYDRKPQYVHLDNLYNYAGCPNKYINPRLDMPTPFVRRGWGRSPNGYPALLQWWKNDGPTTLTANRNLYTPKECKMWNYY